jgi:putative transposase
LDPEVSTTDIKGMKIRLSAHGAYRHQYHVVWISKYRQRILRGELKTFIEQRLFDIHQYHPDIEIEKYSIQDDHLHIVIIIPPRYEKYSIQDDHLHIVIIIPPKYSVSSIIGKIKANTSREIRKHFKWIGKKEVIKRYVEFQEKMDKGQLQLSLDFKI